MPKYIVKSNLDFNGERYVPGDTVELKEKEAEQLLGHTVEPAPAEKPAPGQTKK